MVSLEVITVTITISEKVTPPFFQIYAYHFKFECVLPFPHCCCIFLFGLGFLAMEGMKRKQDAMNIHLIGVERRGFGF